MTETPDEHSIRNEPTIGSRDVEADAVSEEPVFSEVPAEGTDEERAHHNVWDEPVTDPSKKPDDAYTYSTWYESMLASTSTGTRLSVALGLALIGGPLAITVAILMSSTQLALSFVGLVFIGPAVEEVAKITAVAAALERRPYLFNSPSALMACVLLSALSFAAMENVMYIYVYVDDPTAGFRMWRWFVCLPMHMAASSIAGVGLRNALSASRIDLVPPRMAIAYPYVVGAACLHGAYNFFAVSFSEIFEPF